MMKVEEEAVVRMEYVRLGQGGLEVEEHGHYVWMEDTNVNEQRNQRVEMEWR